MIDALQTLSNVVGWSYFTAWSASFYPQIILNYRRQYVGGLSIDFAILNLLGHSSYALYNLAFYFNASVQEEYSRRHDGAVNLVQLNDVAFSIHASTLALITFLQTLYYPRERGQRLSTYNRVVVSLYTLIILANVYGVAIVNTQYLYEFIYVLSLFKLYVSIAKYIPQAWENFTHKSTDGWSIENVLLDFSGGILSFFQLFIDAARVGNWYSITGNPVKFGLSILSMLFTLMFIVQHFVLYPEHHDIYLKKTQRDVSVSPERRRTTSGGERAPLLGP